ncbi:MAG: bL27 family ribosomal protein [Patescibacteria group bacterium]|nr:bL27 family ribosomal protein [Patescibacteria group bacterium]
MAHTKAQGGVKGNRDSLPKHLGIKLYSGQKATPGNIIVRQKGTKFFPGKGISMGKDFTLFAVAEGLVSFKRRFGKAIVEIKN